MLKIALRSLIDFRIAVRDFAVNDHPWIGQSLGYQHSGRYDWRMGVVGIAALLLARPLSFALMCVLWPLAITWTRVSFSDTAVVHHGLWRRTIIPRSGAQLTFRAIPVHEVMPILASCLFRNKEEPLHPNGVRAVVITHALVRNTILGIPLMPRRAEVMVSVLHAALKMNRGTDFSKSVVETPF